MKNLFLSLVLVMIGLFSFSQSPLPNNLNLKEIQKEFMILYNKRCDSLGHNIVEDKSLLCLTECQLNYLKDFQHISHEQEIGSKFYSLVDRYAFFYPQMSKTSGVNLEMSEIISLVNVGNTLNKQTNKGMAKKLFDNFLESDPHKRIMDNKKLIKVNFQVEINKFNSIYIVGVLSNQTLK